MSIEPTPENITKMVDGIDNNREILERLMQKIHDDMDHALIKGLATYPQQPDSPRDTSLLLLLVQNYVAGFLTAECDPPEDFSKAVRWFYAKGVEHGIAYLETRKEFSQ